MNVLSLVPIDLTVFFLNVPVYVIAFGICSILTFCMKNADKVIIKYDYHKF